eukprot:TRINITY_DN6200_c0_g1_i1.p2 TRINITY_DN6200_c0_g1~~TRINITY_DN6200_c0_g1_i1.p2  ORF type:complete len:162 (-),score=35.92 TRINITY_DN6200_c0_g1_i1:396-881(-)
MCIRDRSTWGLQSQFKKMSVNPNVQDAFVNPAAGSKDIDEISSKNAQLEALDKEFQDLLQHISGDENLEKYRSEYEKLYKAFRKSFENEKRLVKHCKDLSENIITNAASVKAALEMSQEDSNTIKRLKKEIEKAWQFVEKAREKEEKSKKMVTDLKSEIVN